MKPGTEKDSKQSQRGAENKNAPAKEHNTAKQDAQNTKTEPSKENVSGQEQVSPQRQSALKKDPTSNMDNDSIETQERGSDDQKHWDDEPEKEKPDGDKEPRTKIHTSRPDELP